MKHPVQSAQSEDFLAHALCRAYADLVREELMRLPGGDDDLVIPVSGLDAISVAEYEATFGSHGSR